MDTPQTITHVSLCAGYGGIDIGLKRAIPNLRTIAFSEIEAYACANLVAKMEAGLLGAAPIWSDLKSFPWENFRGKVDILSSGYPCQPFSASGKRQGAEDPRHLWPYIADGIVRMQPRVCFFENVEGHITLGLRDVLHDLAGMGYRTTWCVASASEVGAPHQRKRVFILADSKCSCSARLERICREPCSLAEPEGYKACVGRVGIWPSRPGEPQHAWEPPRVVDNADAVAARRVSRILGSPQGEEQGQGLQRQRARDAAGYASEDAERQTQPPLGRDADGPASRMDYAELYTTCDNRTDELRLLGNGVVPATAERAFRILSDELF